MMDPAQDQTGGGGLELERAAAALHPHDHAVAGLETAKAGGEGLAIARELVRVGTGRLEQAPGRHVHQLDGAMLVHGHQGDGDMGDHALEVLRLFLTLGAAGAELVQDPGHGRAQVGKGAVARQSGKGDAIVIERHRVQKARDFASRTGGKMHQGQYLAGDDGEQKRDGDIPAGVEHHPGQHCQGRDQRGEPEQDAGLEAAIVHISPSAGTARRVSGPRLRRRG